MKTTQKKIGFQHLAITLSALGAVGLSTRHADAAPEPSPLVSSFEVAHATQLGEGDKGKDESGDKDKSEKKKKKTEKKKGKKHGSCGAKGGCGAGTCG